MNMNKALQHLYKAVSGNDTSKVNISKLLVDIHYAMTGVECAVKNNWAKIIDSIATNWSGGGGSSDFSTAEVTFAGSGSGHIDIPLVMTASEDFPLNALYTYRESISILKEDLGSTVTVPLYKGGLVIGMEAEATLSGNIEHLEGYDYLITGDCTITISE